MLQLRGPIGADAGGTTLATTIADIARRAGVSTATVDRALNGRAGVSLANRQRVMSAARALGYLPIEDGLPLPSRPVHLQFLIPSVNNGFMSDMADAIRAFAARLPMVSTCTVRALGGLGPDALVPALEGLPLETSGVGLVTIDHPKTRAAIRRLGDAGLPVVTIASDVAEPSRAAYVGVDNRMAGRTAALLMGRLAGAGPVGLFLGTRAYGAHAERAAGFVEVLARDFPALRLLPEVETAEDDRRSEAATRAMLRAGPGLAGIYSVGAGRAGILAALDGQRPRPVVIMHDLTEQTRGGLASGEIDVVIDQNARLVAEQAVIRLLAAIAVQTPLLAQKNIEPRLILRENIPSA